MGTELTPYDFEIVATPEQMRGHVNRIQEVMKAVMQGPSNENPDGVHYGKIPGVKKLMLFKPGAEVLGVAFHIAPRYEVEDLGGDGFSRYRVRCIGSYQHTGMVVGEGMGACSSLEEKYKWRKANNDKEFVDTPTDQRRSKFGYNRTERTEFEIKQVRTEAADLDNTILKMACKRAQIAMIINVTAASDIFTQDIEDLPEELQREIADGDVVVSKTPIQIPRAAGTIGKSDPSPTDAPAEAGEVAYIKNKLAVLPGTTGADLLAKLGLTIPGLTKSGFAAIKEALKK